jgi:hypothetical protein
MFMNWPSEAPADLRSWVANARARFDVIMGGGECWPVTVGERDQGCDATWLTSLISALIGTPREEIARSDAATAPERLRRAAVVAALGAAERAALWAGLDGAVIVNNSLLSVSPLGSMRLPALRGALAAAAERWPDRVVVARGLIAEADAVRAVARAAGGVFLPNRVSYAFDLRDGRTPDKINAVRDLSLLEKAGLDVIAHDEFTIDHLLCAQAAYDEVYVGRHGARNPRVTPTFVQAVHAAGIARFHGLGRDGVLLAFVTLRDHGEFLSVPWIGYRTAVDRKAGLYRQVFALALREGARRRAVVNFGAGAARYKTLRGGVPAVEHMILVPPRASRLGQAFAAALRTLEAPLGRAVPQAIAAYGG